MERSEMWEEDMANIMSFTKTLCLPYDRIFFIGLKFLSLLIVRKSESGFLNYTKSPMAKVNIVWNAEILD
jgi:hypothetical protein